jgi:ATP-dependent protease HslVU (ClpYQ) peptidase subunit
MTTLAVRDGKIAADSRETIEGEGGDYCRKCDKLFEFPGPPTLIVGLAGESGPGLAFLEWLRGGTDELRDQLRSADVDFTAVVLYANGKVFEYDKWCIPVEITAPFYACGTGAKVALGAMKAGATAAEAVIIAAEIDPYTALPVTVKGFK